MGGVGECNRENWDNCNRITIKNKTKKLGKRICEDMKGLGRVRVKGSIVTYLNFKVQERYRIRSPWSTQACCRAIGEHELEGPVSGCIDQTGESMT